MNYAELAQWANCVIDTRNAMASVPTKAGQVWKAQEGKRLACSFRRVAESIRLSTIDYSNSTSPSADKRRTDDF